MLGASFLPAGIRSSNGSSDATKPRWLSRHITPILHYVSRRACTHPIHTIVFVAVVASTTYISLLEGSLFDQKVPARSPVAGADLDTLLVGSKRLKLGHETGWKWQVADDYEDKASVRVSFTVVETSCWIMLTFAKNAQELALLTLVFPDSLSSSSPRIAPPAQSVPLPVNSSAQLLPCSTNPLSPISYDTTLAFSVPFDEAPQFLAVTQEIPASASPRIRTENDGTPDEEERWIMKAARPSDLGRRSLRNWAIDSWTTFVDLLKVEDLHLRSLPMLIDARRMPSRSTSSSWCWDTCPCTSRSFLSFSP